jgi:hypothetical protein
MSRTHFETFDSEFSVGSVGPGVHDCSAYLFLRDLGDEVLKKMNFFQKTADLWAFVEASAFAQGSGEICLRETSAWQARRRGRLQCPNALRGELLLRKKLGGMPRTGSGMPGNSNTDTERGQIQYDHYKSKEIHSHRESYCGVHCQNANQPKKSGLFHPNKNRITDLDQAD